MGKKTGKPRGRPKGSKNKGSKPHVEAMEQAVAMVSEVIPNAFQGDAHAFMMAIYKDPAQALPLRLDAAKAAVKFEKPALAAIADLRPPGDEDVPDVISRETGQDHLSALSKRYAGGLRVIEGGVPPKANGHANGKGH